MDAKSMVQSLRTLRCPPPIFLPLIGLVGCFLAAAATPYLSRRVNLAEQRANPGKLVVRENDLVWKPSPSDESSELARFRFEVLNVGGSPVEVLSAQSSCGCAKPVVSPSVISPGGTAFVEITAAPPPSGSRGVAIILDTDSAQKRSVALNATIYSRRKPPYVITATGNLNFTGTRLADTKGSVSVYVAAEEKPDREPIVRTDLDFLGFEN